MAAIWTPSVNMLGWSTMVHVCTSWRRTIILSAPLWDHEVGVVCSPDSFRIMLSRARDAPVTRKNSWALRNFFFKMQTNILTSSIFAFIVQVSYNSRNRSMFAKHWYIYIFGEHSSFLYYRSPTGHFIVALDRRLNKWHIHVTASIENLREISYNNMYIPFRIPSLVSLNINADKEITGRSNTHVPCWEFLQTLKSCQRLVEISLFAWMPVNADALLADPYRVRLLCFQELTAGKPHAHAPFMSLFQNLEPPELERLSLDDDNNPVAPALSFAFTWLLSHEHVPPCIQNIHFLNIKGSTDSDFVGMKSRASAQFPFSVINDSFRTAPRPLVFVSMSILRRPKQYCTAYF